MTDKIITTIGLAKRAKRVVYGFETVKHAVNFGEAQLVLLAENLSPKTAQSVANICESCETELMHLPFTMEDMADAVGKPCGVFAVTDSGFAKLIREQIQRRNTL